VAAGGEGKGRGENKNKAKELRGYCTVGASHEENSKHLSILWKLY
jgi:hypothetical protein